MSRRSAPRSGVTDYRVDALLNAAEGGSLNHIYRMETEWPTTLRHAKRAFGILISHLDVSDIPSLAGEGNPELIRRLELVKACLGPINAGMNYAFEGAGKDYRTELFEVVGPHIHRILQATEFSQHHASYFAADKENADFYTMVCGTALIHKIVLSFLPELEKEDGHPTLRAIVDFQLQNWVDSIPETPPHESTTTPSQYKVEQSVFLIVLRQCLNEESLKTILLERIHAFTRRQHKQLAHCFVYRCHEWIAIHRRVPERDLICDDLVDYVGTAQRLAVVPEFYRALVRCRLASLGLKLALQVRHAISTNEAGGSVVFEMASQIFPPERNHAYELVHVVPELLAEGLLKVMFLVGPKGIESALRLWNGHNVLELLHKVGHHPRVSRAMRSAIDALSSDELREIRAKDKKKIFDTLLTGDPGLGQYLRSYESPDIVLCDCLEHSAIHSGGQPSTKAYECSWCQSVVYCSPRCQEKDWEMLHKYECGTDRVNRIDLQLNGAWLSHRSRARYLRYLQIFYGNLFRSGGLSPQVQGQKMVYIVNGAKWLGGQMAAFAADALPFVLRPGGRTCFTDPRSLAMVEQAKQDKTIDLLVFVGRIGQYFVAALGMFRAKRGIFSAGPTGQENRAADDPEPGRPRPLNIHLRVFEGYPGVEGIETGLGVRIAGLAES